jgi:hypothetical protein
MATRLAAVRERVVQAGATRLAPCRVCASLVSKAIAGPRASCPVPSVEPSSNDDHVRHRFECAFHTPRDLGRFVVSG